MQAEAYCLMTYKCTECGRHEELWNSRNGITPFCITCQHCQGTARHIDWKSDRCVPDHVPDDNQRVFVDMTTDRMHAIHMNRVNDCWEQDKYPMKEHFETKGEALELLMVAWDESRGVPDIISGADFKTRTVSANTNE